MKSDAKILAIDGGPKALAGATGVPQPKIGVEEFLSVAERFGFKPAALKRLAGCVTVEWLAARGLRLAFVSDPAKTRLTILGPRKPPFLARSFPQNGLGASARADDPRKC